MGETGTIAVNSRKKQVSDVDEYHLTGRLGGGATLAHTAVCVRLLVADGN